MIVGRATRARIWDPAPGPSTKLPRITVSLFLRIRAWAPAYSSAGWERLWTNRTWSCQVPGQELVHRVPVAGTEACPNLSHPYDRVRMLCNPARCLLLPQSAQDLPYSSHVIRGAARPRYGLLPGSTVLGSDLVDNTVACRGRPPANRSSSRTPTAQGSLLTIPASSMLQERSVSAPVAMSGLLG